VRRAAAVLVAAALIAGCGGGGSKDAQKPAPAPNVADGQAVIRGWTEAIYKSDFEKAARYFAKDAIVQQSETIYLRTHQDAVAFGLSLPCRAKVTSITSEPHGVLLASFKLFPGVGGSCPAGGNARVRFFIRKGLIESFRQLPDKPTPHGESI
jgi:hypothetical protein